MDDQERQHLSEMVTSWTVLERAHDGTDSDSATAQQAVLNRYAPAIHRYLLGAVRDRERADDLFQEFALKFLRGDFRRADRDRGRFRDYLKTSLYHLVVREQTRRRSVSLTADVPEPEASDAGPTADDGFLTIWKEELIRGAWKALEEREARDGRPLHTVLRFRADHPTLDSQAVARELSARLRRDLSTEWVRKWVHLARKQFSADLCDEVARSLASGPPTADELEDELQALGWLDNCREALRDRFR